VYWSALVNAELPVGVSTVTSTVPGAWAGATARMEVSDSMKNAAGTEPNRTWLAALSRVPVMVTTVPPAVVPLVVDRELTAGAVAAL
jgi:hypothetical protein